MRIPQNLPDHHILYCRHQDGGHQVEISYEKNRTYFLLYKKGLISPLKYTSRRKLLIEVTGHTSGRNWSFNRYFRLGSHNTTVPHNPSLNLIELFSSDKIIEIKALPPIGINLTSRSDEVAKLLFAGFGSWIHSAGYDPQEVLQEVYKGLLIRNNGTCPWDPNKATFGYYVHMVCRGIVGNWHRKIKRINSYETIGITTFDQAGNLTKQDVGSANLPTLPTPTEYEMDDVTKDLLNFIPLGPDTHLARLILPYIRDGHTISEIARRFKTKRAEVFTARDILQKYAKKWDLLH